MAGKRQVDGAHQKLALQHNLGLGGACVVALYKRYDANNKNGWVRKDQTADPSILE